MNTHNLALRSIAGFAAGTLIILATLPAQADDREGDRHHGDKKVSVEMFAPQRGDHAGVGGRAWFVDLAVSYEGGLESSGFTTPQLTGPGVHASAAPFPGTFSPGKDDRLPGLIVLLSTTTLGAGACQNVSNLFNLTGVTDVDQGQAEIWDTWIVGAPLFGVGVKSEIFVAVADDLNGDGVYNDAPDALPDANGDGRCDEADLRRFGVASNIEKTRFFINP